VLDYEQSSGGWRASGHIHWLIGDRLH